jgi:serine/threonine-protein kinase haspin
VSIPVKVGLILFEQHRDLHEGNLCIRRTGPRKKRTASSEGFFANSGLDITILDYGLSRAEDLSVDFAEPVCYDMEKDLSFFTSTHASQCRVYRQMRSFLLRADRTCLPPEEHTEPYAKGIDGPLSWQAYAPYTNVLWLAYLYDYLVTHFAGESKQLTQFKKQTREMWKYLDPDAGADVPCFGSAAEVVCFAVEAGWVREEQLTGAEASFMEREDSIIISKDGCWEDASVRRSPSRRQSTLVT